MVSSCSLLWLYSFLMGYLFFGEQRPENPLTGTMVFEGEGHMKGSPLHSYPLNRKEVVESNGSEEANQLWIQEK